MSIQPKASEPSVASRTSPQRRRRPSGEAPPLPRDLASARYWIVLAICVVALWSLLVVTGVAGRVIGFETRVDMAVLHTIAGWRSDAATAVMRALHALGSQWTVAVAAWLVVLITAAFKRWRQLLVLVLSLWIVGTVTENASRIVARARPAVERIGEWSGFAFPSLQVAAVTALLVGACYSLLPAGRVRSLGKWVAAGIVALLAAARLYLGVDHPTDVVVAVAVGWAIPLVGFRMFAPNAIFPVSYRRRRSAHLPIDQRRLDGIRAALRDQLAVELRTVEPFHLEQSFGSTPLKIELDDEAGTVLFGKLYAASHMRADRWYKLWRTLAYGRLEDERSFSTVRRLVQYEDYMLRVMHDAGIPVARPYGFVSITPEREYLLVTEFVQGAEESGKASITPAVIDDGLRVVRQLWHNGLAHRDIKPANVLVKDERVILIDLAFGQVRPSPWREAVDLANMLLVLGLRSTPELVYERALQFFSADEIAEALASTSEAGRPSLRRMLRADGRDLLMRFRQLAPAHARVRVQRWSARRVGLTALVAVCALVGVNLAVSNIQGAGSLDDPIRTAPTGAPAGAGTLSDDRLSPACEGEGTGTGTLLLLAQASARAALVPCVAQAPPGWSLSGIHIRRGAAQLRFDSDRAGAGALVVEALSSCETGDGVQVPSDEDGALRYERVDSLAERYRGVRWYVFPGGCVQYTFDANLDGWTALGNEASVGLSFVSRDVVAQRYEEMTGGLTGP